MNPEIETQPSHLLAAVAEARTQLGNATRSLREILQSDPIIAGTPIEAQAAMAAALAAIDSAQRALGRATPKAPAPPPKDPNAPTRQQGQFLAFIHAYMLRTHSGIAPSHADLQRYFDLTAPSVNSMLIRLEERGFIKRIRGQARAIELVIAPDLLPKLERPLRR